MGAATVAVGVRGGADGAADAENDKVGGGRGGRGVILLSIMYLAHGDSQQQEQQEQQGRQRGRVCVCIGRNNRNNRGKCV